VVNEMPFCTYCGAQVDPTRPYCPSCGAKLERAASTATVQMSMKDRGSELEDSIADYFRKSGLDVQARVKMRDRFDVSHEIDVLASKREDYGSIQIAVECKHVQSSIDIKEVRNFHDKLSALGITKGVFVSTGGFTADAESHANALGIELWDMKIVQSKLSSLQIPQKDVIHDALSFDPASIGLLKPRHLKNFQTLSESIQLMYVPVYFADYHCFAEHTVAGNSVVLESKGTVAIDGVNGRVIDSTSTGIAPALPRNGAFIGCATMQPQTLTSNSLPHVPLTIPVPKVETVRARDIAKAELVKAISYNYEYRTTRTSGSKLLKPRRKDVDVLEIRPMKVPLLLATFRSKNNAYARTCVASTGIFTLDQTTTCAQCRNPAVWVCENCGGIACESHSRACSSCGRHLCSACVVSKGIISKTFYCPEHQPR